MLVVLINDSWGRALPMVSGRMWTVSDIVMQRLKSVKRDRGRFKTSGPKASPRALYRRSAMAPVWENTTSKGMTDWCWGSDLSLTCTEASSAKVRDFSTHTPGSSVLSWLGISGLLNIWFPLTIYSRNFVGWQAESFCSLSARIHVLRM